MLQLPAQHQPYFWSPYPDKHCKYSEQVHHHDPLVHFYLTVQSLNPDFCFSICEKSKYKDEIWSFFKIFFSEDYQKQLTSFSVMSDLYKNKTNEKDMEITEDFLNEIVNANIEYGFEKEISDILLENLNYYFENRLSFIELQNYLDGKIGIYLKETNYSKS